MPDYLKIDEVKAGDTVLLDDGFTCVPACRVQILSDESGLFFMCHGPFGEEEDELVCRHYIDGQAAGEDDKNYPEGTLVGISRG